MVVTGGVAVGLSIVGLLRKATGVQVYCVAPLAVACRMVELILQMVSLGPASMVSIDAVIFLLILSLHPLISVTTNFTV